MKTSRMSSGDLGAMNLMPALLSILAVLSIQCSSERQEAPNRSHKDLASPEPAHATISVNSVMPHEGEVFTQGLTFWNGRLFEGSGLYGQSILRELDPVTGKELRRHALEDTYFGEGIAILNDNIYQLTWKEQVCFVYNIHDFSLQTVLKYKGEGWGLTTDGQSLIMSDGSDKIRFRDPRTMEVTKTLNVRLNHQPVMRLNELEYIDQEIWANIWESHTIVRISPESGEVLSTIDASLLLRGQAYARNPANVLNGIAFDPLKKRLLLTGKRWPIIAEVQVSQ